MQSAGGMRLPMGVLFDAAFGEQLGDLVALSLLYLLDSRNECRVASLSTSKHNLASAGLYEVYQKLYGGRPTAIGMATHSQGTATGAVLKSAVAGQSINVKSEVDTAEPHGLMRNMLQAYHDGNTVIVCLGPTHNLRDLLQLPTAKPVVTAKAKMLYLAGDEAAPQGWPTPVTVVDRGRVSGLKYRPKPEDFAWAENHPVALALKAQPDAELDLRGAVAVLEAVRGKELKDVDALLAELVAAKPAPRQRPRFLG